MSTIKRKHKLKDQFFFFFFFVLALCIFAFALQQDDNEISLRYNTSTRIFVVPPSSNTFSEWRRMRHVS